MDGWMNKGNINAAVKIKEKGNCTGGGIVNRKSVFYGKKSDILF
jgi:hypothetical protein